MIEDATAAPNTEEPMAKKAAPKKRAKRKASPKKAKRAAATRKKHGGPGRKGYSPEKKAAILAAAKKGNLTGDQVAAKFGISTLTFYKWRGPVRGKKRGRPVGSKNRVAGRVKVDLASVRREVQAQVRALLPRIIREEVAAALKNL